MNESLTRLLDIYISSNHVEGAFYINGLWGSGKTYFINDYFKNEKYKDNYFYVSLYGMNSIDEINKELFVLLNPKINACLNKGISQLFLKVIDSQIGPYGIESEKILNVITDSKLKSKIIVLDDLERTGIDIQELFGWISVVLHSNKVILIGNDEEVRRYLQQKQSFHYQIVSGLISDNINNYKENISKVQEPLMYDAIKEKVIYKQYEFAFDDDILFKIISSKYKKSTRKLLLKNKQLIKYILSYYKCSNLRICKIALENFEEITKLLRKKYNNDFEVKNDIFISTFIYTTMFKTGSSSFCDYEALDYKYQSKKINQIKKFVTRLAFNRNMALKELEKIDDDITVIKENNYPSVFTPLLGSWFEKTDEDIIKGIELLVNSIESLEFKYYYKALDLICLFNEWFGLEKAYKIEEIITKMKKNIKESEEIIDDHDDAFLYCSSDSNVSSVYFSEIRDEIKTHNLAIRQNNINEEIKVQKEYTDEELIEISKNALVYKSFFENIDVDLLIASIENNDQLYMLNIKKLLNQVYGFTNVRDFYSDDYDNLQKFYEELTELKIESVVKKQVKNNLLNDLKEYLEKLRPQA